MESYWIWTSDSSSKFSKRSCSVHWASSLQSENNSPISLLKTEIRTVLFSLFRTWIFEWPVMYTRFDLDRHPTLCAAGQFVVLQNNSVTTNKARIRFWNFAHSADASLCHECIRNKFARKVYVNQDHSVSAYTKLIKHVFLFMNSWIINLGRVVRKADSVIRWIVIFKPL